MQTATNFPAVLFRDAYPIGDTDVRALPVKELGDALAYYERVLRFNLISQTEHAAILQRGEVEIGLEENDADPEQSSVYFAVSNLDALRAELETAGMEISPVRINEHNNKRFRVFFGKEPYGVCFCFGEPAELA